MLLNLSEYYRPESIESALKLMSGGNGRRFILAGGTRLVGSGNPAVHGVVDIGRLGLNRIRTADGDILIGATATVQQIGESALVGQYAGGLLSRAVLRETVSKMLRNQATLGGELFSCDRFSALAAVILALEGRIQLRRPEPVTLESEEFFANRDGMLPASMLITDVLFKDRCAESGCDLERLSTLPSSVPILSVATSLQREGARVRQIRIAVSGGYQHPSRLRAIERDLEGRLFAEIRLEELRSCIPPLLDPSSDMRASSEYRSRVAPVLVFRSLRNSWRRASAQLGERTKTE